MTINPEESSTSEALEGAPAEAGAAATDVNAEPSTAETGVKAEESSLLDVLRDAVKPEEAETQAPASEAKKDEPAEAATEAEPAEDAADSKLPFAKHPRWQQVQAQRRAAQAEASDAKTKLSEAEQQIQSLEPVARQFGAIEAFRQQNNLEVGELAEGLKWAAAVKNNPDAAITLLMPVFEKLMTASGRTLPADLRQDVEEGRITEERARELSMARARGERATEQATRAEQDAETQRARRAAEDLGANIQNSIAEWETAERGRDPDFDRKQPMIVAQAKAIAADEGNPKSPEEALAIVKRAHQAVTEHLRSVLPKPREIRRPPAGSPHVETRPAPKSLREAIANAI